MAKPITPASQPPAPAPGAPPAPETTLAPVAPEVAPSPEAPATSEPAEVPKTPEVSPEPSEAAPTQTYRVNWYFLGFKDQAFNEGDLVEATEEEAAPYLGGVLSLES